MLRINLMRLAREHRGTLVKPANIAATLVGPDKRWCKICHRVVENKHWDAHQQDRNHTRAAASLRRMKSLSLQMWESHRGAPADESNVESEANIAKEFADFKRSQLSREEKLVRRR